ncbi:Transposase domain [Pseudomonas trivialis]|uniref:Transposase domain n=1 Tax=Pseudomonas trivialis TaxID=200450 RepID=A0A0R2ZIJ0_9PSED|nr:hypothetical protein TU79_21135 [Pseudomonas trivialis]SDS91296.1 Transposase domain [Pseudomonas trivialis]
MVNLGFEGAIPADTGRPAYHPAILLKIYIYGYLNRIQSSRRLEREVQRNVELMWLTGRLMPDFKTIANFRKDNSKATDGDSDLAVLIRQFQFKDIRPKAASEIELSHASRLLGHSTAEITRKVYRRVGEIVNPTK